MKILRTLSTLVVTSAGLPVAASEGGAGGAALLTPQLGTIFWTVVTFVLLVFLLRRFAWGPLLGAIDAREQSIRGSFEEAKANREEAEALLSQHRELLTEARRERAEAVEQGRQDAERVKSEILDEARKQRDQLLKQTDAQLEAGLRQARDQLRSEAADLAILAAQKLLRETLDEATHRKLVEDYLADLERSGGDSRTLPS